MNERDLEQRLSRLRLARQPGEYLTKGLGLIGSMSVPQIPWYRRLPLALTAALVLSIAANVFQLVHNRQQILSLESEQPGQCQTPAVALAPSGTGKLPDLFTKRRMPTPEGMC